MAMQCAILDDYQGVALTCADWSGLAPAVEPVVFSDTISGDALVDRLQTFEVIVAMRERTPFDAALLARLPNLRLLVTTGMRNASIDMEAAKAQGVTVCGTASLGHPTPELTWGLLLALARRIPQEDAALRSGGWQTTLGMDLKGKTLGLIGFGRVAQAMARYGIAFEMEVLAFSRSLTDEAAAEKGVRRANGLPALLAKADVVSLHVPLNDSTRHIIGADALAAMKPSAYLLNTSRAGVVDTDALAAALRSGQIAGAGVDVHEPEPLNGTSPLLTAPNTVLTPHLGYVSQDNYAGFYTEAVANIRGWLNGAPLRVLA
ncbi:D-2-hydroxyacid dehydrogenase family protein [Vannielia litorea]|uniref:D-2-hydroxyacid dehydrogenase family protein n=1 Tax=Vannielia litorea TaxID=1217970 RepID=UPI001C968DF5|nr:D-2-hydroxyacid dehydrogenase family protein [Vannielia litorea]MBY6155062.1 D-2-hydroxyacid dehydrogenase family protein [Vannielia litorea]